MITAVIRANQNIQIISMRFGIRFLLLTIFVCALAALLVSRLIQSREHQRQVEAFSNFRVVSLALQSYDSRFGHLPSPTYYDPKTAAPLYSWRYSILHRYVQYGQSAYLDFAWDHPKNSIWRDVPHPFAPNFPPTRSKVPTMTNVYAITGNDTAFGNARDLQPQQLENLPNDLILVAEIENSGHHWMKPGDFIVGEINQSIGSNGQASISGAMNGGFHIIFADLEVWFISNETPFDSLSKFFTISSATEFDRNEILGKHRIR